MERFGVFVDAGYLFAAAGELCCGTRDRSKLRLDHVAMAEGLAKIAADDCGLGHLRTYWYDGAKGGAATAQHLSIGSLPGVKVRLGRLTPSGQKGVDSRVVRDLIILSQERAISMAYLLGGDEDLREGVSEAQERGVRVVLLDIERASGRGIAQTLEMEADAILRLDKKFLSKRISLVSPTATAPASVPAPISAPPAPIDVGREFGVTWLTTVPPEAASITRAGRPRIPADLDRQLLEQATVRLSRAHLSDEDRAAIRYGFWDALTAGPADLLSAP